MILYGTHFTVQCYTIPHSITPYSYVQLLTIGQLPRVSTEDRVVSVFETSVGQLPRVSTEDRVVSVFETSVCLSVCSLSVLCQQIFSFFPLSSFSFYTVQYRRVQYSTVIYLQSNVSTTKLFVNHG